MRSFTTADLNKQVGTVTDAARREPVLITHHRKPRYVLLSVESYEQMAGQRADDPRRSFTLDTIPDDLRDGLLDLADRYDAEADRGDEAPKTGLVISYRLLWAREHDRSAEHGRKARPACVVIPLTRRPGDLVLLPLTTQEPEAGRLAVRVPEIERRRLRLKGAAATWVLLDEGSRDVLPGSFHVEPIAYDPLTYAYGSFSQAFMRVVLRTLATALRSGRIRMVTRER